MNKDEMDIYNQIKAALDQVKVMAMNEQWGDDKDRWSRGVKQALVSVGKKNKFTTAANKVGSDAAGEFLYDVAWYVLDEEGYAIDVTLAAESEWGSGGEVEADFEKLLQARAQYKVMIFQTSGSDSVKTLKVTMEENIKRYRGTQSSDTYLLVGWDIDKWDIDIYRDGRLEKI